MITFGLLGLAICSVWMKPVGIRKDLAMPLWPFLLAAATVSGLVEGYLTWPALLALASLLVVAYLAGRHEASGTQQIIFATIAALLALALAVHRLPGFNNPTVMANVRLTADAAPFTQYANFDKAAAGLILLALLCNRAKSASEWRELLRRTFPVMLVAAIAVMVVAVVVGYVKWEPKLPDSALAFLAINLLFTCVAEEAFFRGLLQERLTRLLERVRFGNAVAIAVSVVLFGAVHFAGGARYVALAILAGLAYAYAYAVTRRVEAPIITHFTVNAVHFIGFTYPQLG